MSLETFASALEFRNWLKQHHATTSELLVRCYRTQAKDKGLTYREALDEALCFGWIDGVRRAVDDESFSTRFTPRKAKSKWSLVNIRRAEELEIEGRMQPAGRRAFAARDANHATRYSFEDRPRKLDQASEKLFR